MQEIDGMDMLGYLKLRAWKASERKEQPNTGTPTQRRIDEIWPMSGL